MRAAERNEEIADERLTLSLNVHLGNGLSIDEVERWWCEQLRLPMPCLRKATVNRVSRSSQRKRRALVHGTARLAVNSSTFVVQSIYGGIQAYSGFERRKWLG